MFFTAIKSQSPTYIKNLENILSRCLNYFSLFPTVNDSKIYVRLQNFEVNSKT